MKNIGINIKDANKYDLWVGEIVTCIKGYDGRYGKINAYPKVGQDYNIISISNQEGGWSLDFFTNKKVNKIRRKEKLST